MEEEIDLEQSIPLPIMFWIDYIKQNLAPSYESAKKKRNPTIKIILQPLPELVFSILTGCKDLEEKKNTVKMTSTRMERLFGPDWDVATYEWGSRGIDSIIKTTSPVLEYQKEQKKLVMRRLGRRRRRRRRRR